MSVPRFDEWCINIGADWQETVTIQDSTLTITAAAMMVRYKLNDSSPVVSITLAGGGITQADDADGYPVLTLAITDTVTSTLRPGDAVYDIQYTDDTGKVVFILQGDIEIRKPVTR